MKPSLVIRLLSCFIGLMAVHGCCDKCDAQQRTTFGPGYQQPGYYQPPVYYQPPAVPANRLDRKVDGHTQYNAGRSAEPPSAETEKLWMFLITSDSWQSNERERQLVSWFNNDPRLVKLRAGTRFNWYGASNPHYRDRLRYKVGESLPIVCIQRPDGEAILNVTAISMPRTSGELADMADDAINARYSAPTVRTQSPFTTQIVEDCPNCPDQAPAPPSPDGSNRIEPIPEVIPSRTSLLPALLIGALFVFVGVPSLVICALLFWPRRPSATLFGS